MPKNDENNICIGDEYELFYWDGGWISLGRQKALTKNLIYKNVSSDALFLLHDYTKGTEERIFTYENGEQIWW